jgi:hypothetical protein
VVAQQVGQLGPVGAVLVNAQLEVLAEVLVELAVVILVLRNLAEHLGRVAVVKWGYRLGFATEHKNAQGSPVDGCAGQVAMHPAAGKGAHIAARPALGTVRRPTQLAKTQP